MAAGPQRLSALSGWTGTKLEALPDADPQIVQAVPSMRWVYWWQIKKNKRTNK